jgi:hypothetical protein
VVEQRPFKPKVVGSIPTAPTKHFMTALETPRPTLEKREWGTLRVSIPSLKLLK